MSTSDAKPFESLVEVSISAVIDIIHDLAKADTRWKVRKIVSALVISSEPLHSILHQHLKVNKLFAR